MDPPISLALAGLGEHMGEFQTGPACPHVLCGTPADDLHRELCGAGTQCPGPCVWPQAGEGCAGGGQAAPPIPPPRGAPDQTGRCSPSLETGSQRKSEPQDKQLVQDKHQVQDKQLYA